MSEWADEHTHGVHILLLVHRMVLECTSQCSYALGGFVEADGGARDPDSGCEDFTGSEGNVHRHLHHHVQSGPEDLEQVQRKQQ